MKELLQYAADNHRDGYDHFNELFDAIVAETLTTTDQIDSWVAEHPNV